MGIGSTLGGIAGFAAGPVGSTIGALAGSALEAIPSLIKTDAEKENEKRRKALQAQQDLGTLGLTEAEKQSLYTAGTNQIQGQLQQAQAQARAAGAAGMASGGGIDALRQALLAQQQAQLASEVAQRTEQQNLARKRELDQELEDRIGAATDYKRDRLEAALTLASGGISTIQKGLQKGLTQGGSMPSPEEIAKFAKLFNLDPKTALELVQTKKKNPDTDPYIDSILTPPAAAPATGVTP